MRDVVWDWLEGNLGDAYSARGKGEDQLIVGMSAIVEQISPIADIRVSCTDLSKCHENLWFGQITLSYDGNLSSHGNLAKAIEFEIKVGSCNVLKRLSNKGSKHKICSIQLPDFLC